MSQDSDKLHHLAIGEGPMNNNNNNISHTATVASRLNLSVANAAAPHHPGQSIARRHKSNGRERDSRDSNLAWGGLWESVYRRDGELMNPISVQLGNRATSCVSTTIHSTTTAATRHYSPSVFDVINRDRPIRLGRASIRLSPVLFTEEEDLDGPT